MQVKKVVKRKLEEGGYIQGHGIDKVWRQI